MKKLIPIIIALVLLAACGQSYEETKRITREQRREAWRKDSAALKIAVMPTLDCLPLFVAQEYELFDTVNGGVRLKLYNAQMDCDTAVLRGRVEGAVTDLCGCNECLLATGDQPQCPYQTAEAVGRQDGGHDALLCNRPADGCGS